MSSSAFTGLALERGIDIAFSRHCSSPTAAYISLTSRLRVAVAKSQRALHVDGQARQAHQQQLCSQNCRSCSRSSLDTSIKPMCPRKSGPTQTGIRCTYPIRPINIAGVVFRLRSWNQRFVVTKPPRLCLKFGANLTPVGCCTGIAVPPAPVPRDRLIVGGATTLRCDPTLRSATVSTGSFDGDRSAIHRDTRLIHWRLAWHRPILNSAT